MLNRNRVQYLKNWNCVFFILKCTVVCVCGGGGGIYKVLSSLGHILKTGFYKAYTPLPSRAIFFGEIGGSSIIIWARRRREIFYKIKRGFRPQWHTQGPTFWAKFSDPGVGPLGGGAFKLFWAPPWGRPSGGSPDPGVGPWGAWLYL